MFGAEFQRASRWLAVVLIAVGLAGCKTLAGAPANAAAEASASEPLDLTYVPASEPLRRGLYHFVRGDYGLAEQYFQAAIEQHPDDVKAWIGIAACYDNMHRFDLADRAYASAIRFGGETTEVLNNQGYSYMLRGDLKTAREKFGKALRRDPHNRTIRNNLRMLDAKLRSNHRAL